MKNYQFCEVKDRVFGVSFVTYRPFEVKTAGLIPPILNFAFSSSKEVIVWV